MPYTILVNTDTESHDERYCDGIFENPNLAGRYIRRRDRPIRNRQYQIIPIEGPLGPENQLSFEQLKRAARFALMTLYDMDEPKPKGFAKASIRKLEEALGEFACLPLKQFKIKWKDGANTTIEGHSLKAAMEDYGYRREIINSPKDFTLEIVETEAVA